MFFLPQVPYASITIITVIHAVELALSIKLWYLERYEIILKNSLTQSLVPLGMSLKQKSKTKQKEFLTIMLHLASLFFFTINIILFNYANNFGPYELFILPFKKIYKLLYLKSMYHY